MSGAFILITRFVFQATFYVQVNDCRTTVGKSVQTMAVCVERGRVWMREVGEGEWVEVVSS